MENAADRHTFLYIFSIFAINIILSLFISLFIFSGLITSSSYISLAILSLVVGIISVKILSQASYSTNRFVIAGALSPIFPSICFYGLINFIISVNLKIALLKVKAPQNATLELLSNIFPVIKLNPLTPMFIFLIFFLIPFIYFTSKREDSKYSLLGWYILSFFIVGIFSFILHLVLTLKI